MDKKQMLKFERICKQFNLGKPKTFIQHRNLNEFRSFDIERINPTHKLILYGKLRKKYIHDGCSFKIVRVGEIILCSAFIIYAGSNVVAHVLANGICYLYLSWLLFKITSGDLNLNVNRYRRRFRFWKNCFNGILS